MAVNEKALLSWRLALKSTSGLGQLNIGQASNHSSLTKRSA